MSYNFNAYFRIKKNQFSVELVRKIIDVILKNNNYSLPKNVKEEKIKIIYNNGDGKGDTLFSKQNDPSAPFEYNLSMLSDKSYSHMPIPKGIIYIKISLPTSYLELHDDSTDEEIKRYKILKEAIIRDCKDIYNLSHPDWGAIAHELTFGEIIFGDPSQFILPVNFYGPKQTEKLDREALSKMGIFKIDNLADGGLMIQFFEDLFSHKGNVLLLNQMNETAKLTHQKLTKYTEGFVKKRLMGIK
jgi:hypothetical protein